MDISEHITLKQSVVEAICSRLGDEIMKLGFKEADITRFPRHDEGIFLLLKDPYTGQKNLACYWWDEEKKHRIGTLQFNSDDTFYADYDVVKPHPNKAKWFVEGVTAWGKADQIKSEPKLLEMPE
jgi:hypothetical protein